MSNILIRENRTRKPTKGLRVKLRTFLNTSSNMNGLKFQLDEDREGNLVIRPKNCDRASFIEALSKVLPELRFEERGIKVV